MRMRGKKLSCWMLAQVFFLVALLVFNITSVSSVANEQDRDGDGHRALRYGGDDCDDRDINRFPGNTEVCDSRHHDEDCDPNTFGYKDTDRDGETDHRCCNRSRSGEMICGTDCDDSNRAIQSGSQVCDGLGVMICEGGRYRKASCPRGTVCVAQPNGTGVCMTRPQGYIPPPRFKPALARPLPVPPSRPATRFHQ